MIPMRTSSIFRSRWMALVWSLGIIWSAIEVAGGPDDTNSAAPVDNGVEQAIAALQ